MHAAGSSSSTGDGAQAPCTESYPLDPQGSPPAVTDVAPGCTLLLVLMTVAPSRTGAAPVPSPVGALPGARGCHMAQFKSLSPQELQAFKRAKDAFEESLLQKDWNCSSRLFPRTRDLRQLQVWERPVALEAELALTLNVLEAAANSSLDHILDQPLHTLHHIHSKLQACVSARGTRAVSGLWPPVRAPVSQALPHTLNSTLLCPQVPARPTPGPRPRGRLHHWLHRLQEAPKKESRNCLEASVMFNLFRLLTRDLKCVASGDQCV
ncbi:interferon lambda-2-like [Pontoporia blainvillei]|uniref:Interferon lambda-2-like n=1 Tax=Pontoporia blainvillei TaxID=48723 RepID=A0ABX0S6U1_PONBL|nr:interferon lambda-2-like [Pontoporia blainvillei]